METELNLIQLKSRGSYELSPIGKIFSRLTP